MRIAIPIWEEKVSPVFDTASRLLVIEIEYQKEVSRLVYFMDEKDLTRRCHRIRSLNVDILICGAVSHAFLQMLLASGLDVIQQISGRTEEVLNAYLHGNISHSRFLMPGCKKYQYQYGSSIKKENLKGLRKRGVKDNGNSKSRLRIKSKG